MLFLFAHPKICGFCISRNFLNIKMHITCCRCNHSRESHGCRTCRSPSQSANIRTVLLPVMRILWKSVFFASTIVCLIVSTGSDRCRQSLNISGCVCVCVCELCLFVSFSKKKHKFWAENA